MGPQIAQHRSYVHTLGPRVGTTHILGALGEVWCFGLPVGPESSYVGFRVEDVRRVASLGFAALCRYCRGLNNYKISKKSKRAVFRMSQSQNSL